MAFFYIKDGIVRIDNKDIFLSDVARIFEKMFNINFGDIYKKEIAVIKRKPTKITEFLDNLKVAIIKRAKIVVITICKNEFSVILIINVLQIIYGGLGVPFPHFLCFPFPNFASSIDW